MRFSRKAVTTGQVTDVRDRGLDQSAPVPSVDEEMAKLVDLRDDGVLSKVEFEVRKARLLNSWSATP